MKFLRYILVMAFIGLLVSCYEVNEDIVINDDGSGTYSAKMDMSQLIEMIQSMAGEEKMTEGGLDKVIDTVLSMKSILDSSKKATPEQRALWKDGKMKMQINIKEKIFKMDMYVPFKSFDNLQQLMSGEANALSGVNEVFGNLFGKDNKQPDDTTAQITDQAVDPSRKGPEMGDFTTIFNVTAKKGLISKKVDADKYKSLMEKPEMAQLKQIGASGMEILYTTQFRLPRPAKTVSNPLLKLSADKKTVTLKYNMLELIENPEKFAYTIEY